MKSDPCVICAAYAGAVIASGSLALGDFPYPEHGGEAFINVIREDGQLSIVAAEHDSLPAQVKQDLTELTAAVVALPVQVQETRLVFSAHGKMVAATRFYEKGIFDPDTPTGIWLWPDWQNSNTVHHLPEFSRVKFLENDRFILVEHRERFPRSDGLDGLISHDYILDVIAPDQRYAWKGLAILRVANTGRWAGVRKDGQLFVGQLQPGNEESIITDRVPIATPAPVENLILLPNGSYLVAELENGDLLTYTGDGSQQIDSIQGTLHTSVTVGRVLGGASFYGSVGSAGNWQFGFFTITDTGQIQFVNLENNAQWPEWSVDSTRPGSNSPSGKYELCWRDIPPFGALDTVILRTPKADPADPLLPLIEEEIARSPSGNWPVITTDWIHWD